MVYRVNKKIYLLMKNLNHFIGNVDPEISNQTVITKAL